MKRICFYPVGGSSTSTSGLHQLDFAGAASGPASWIALSQLQKRTRIGTWSFICAYLCKGLWSCSKIKKCFVLYLSCLIFIAYVFCYGICITLYSKYELSDMICVSIYFIVYEHTYLPRFWVKKLLSNLCYYYIIGMQMSCLFWSLSCMYIYIYIQSLTKVLSLGYKLTWSAPQIYF